MPVSSTQVANILQGQIGMFSAAAQYAQAVSAQYGYQPSSASPIDDPRDSPALQAGMLASGGIRGADYATGALSGAAMFGMAPRILDPFTGTANAVARGYGAAGVAGGIGAGAAVGGAYLALGSVFKWGVDQAVYGAQQHAMLGHQIGGMAPGLSTGQVGQMSNLVSQAARTGMGSVNEMTSLMQQGGADGTVNMQSLSQFQSSFQKLLGNVRSVALALNSSLTEAQQAMQQVRALGVGQDGAAGFLGSMRGIGQASGLSPQQMMGLAQQGAGLGQMTGIGRQAGAMGQMVQGGVLGMVERGGLINNVDLDAGGRYQGAAFRFLGSRYGRTPLAAMMGRDGEYDEAAASQIAGGHLSREQMREMARHNLAAPGSTDRFNARRQELMGRFVSDFGGQAVAPLINEMTRGAGSPETLRAQLTGLTRSDQHGMEQLSRAMPGLRARMATEGSASFQRGAGGGLVDAIGHNVEQLIAPYRDSLQRYGAELAQSAQSVIEDVTRQFVSRPPARADPSTYAKYFRAHIAGGANPVSQAVQAHGMSSPNYFSGAGTGTFLPSGLQIAAHGTGVRPGELPMNGFAPIGHNAWAGAAALGSIPWSGGRNMLGMAGAGIDAMGAGTMAAFASESSGFMGLGGVGMLSGGGRLAGLGARGLGMAMRAGGALTGALALPMLGADIAMNEIPEIQRNLGQRAITQGAILGQGAEALKFANSNGLLSDPLQERGVGSWSGGMDYESMQRQGLTAVGGLSSEGHQLFATQASLASANKLMEGSAAAMSAFGRYGKIGSLALASAGLSGGTPQRQAMVLSNQLGIPLSEAARTITALKMQGLTADDSGRNPEQYRKDWVKRNSMFSMDGKVDTAQTLMTKGRDARYAAQLGGQTLDKMEEEWESQGLTRSHPEWKVRLADAFSRIDPTLAGEDYMSYAQAALAPTTKPLSGGGWNDVLNQEHAYNWGATGATVNGMLKGEQQAARQGVWSAATIGGIDSSRMGQYVDKFTEGLTKDGEDMRVRAPEQAMQDMLADPNVTSKGAGMMSARLASGGTAAEQRLAIYSGEVARLRYDTQRGRSASKIIQNLMGANYGSAAGKMDQHFKRGSHWTAGIEANLVKSVQELYQLGGSTGPINPNEVEALAREIDQAGVDYAKNHNKHAFDKVATKIATLENQAPSGGGGQPGDFTKQMTEVVSGMREFSAALNLITGNPLVRAAVAVAQATSSSAP